MQQLLRRPGSDRVAWPTPAWIAKTDLHYEIEAATGKPFIPVEEEPVPTSAKGITPDVAAQKQLKASETQLIPEGTDKAEIVPHCANEKGLQGGQDGKTPLSYDPETGQMYYCETVSYIGRKIARGPGGAN